MNTIATMLKVLDQVKYGQDKQPAITTIVEYLKDTFDLDVVYNESFGYSYNNHSINIRAIGCYNKNFEVRVFFTRGDQMDVGLIGDDLRSQINKIVGDAPNIEIPSSLSDVNAIKRIAKAISNIKEYIDSIPSRTEKVKNLLEEVQSKVEATCQWVESIGGIVLGDRTTTPRVKTKNSIVRCSVHCDGDLRFESGACGSGYVSNVKKYFEYMNNFVDGE